jgi:hypothetical protein
MDSRPSDEMLLAVAERDVITRPRVLPDGEGASGLPEGAGALARRPSTRAVAPLWAVTVLAAVAGAALTVVAGGDLARG